MTTEVQWSELQRDPKHIAEMAEDSAVRLRRRDGVSLLLIREDRLAGVTEGTVNAARAMRGLLAHVPADDLAEALADEFPWVKFLSKAGQGSFVQDFSRAFQASAELDQWGILTQILREWKATAAICADPVLSKALSEPITGDFGPVPNPTEV